LFKGTYIVDGLVRWFVVVFAAVAFAGGNPLKTMGRTRHGKIASLPHAVREEVNLRLRAGEEQRVIAAWLKSHEAVKAVLEEKFGGEPVSLQNLSDWKRHGHREWLLRREATEDARAIQEEAAELQQATPGGLADPFAEVLMARLTGAFRRWDGHGRSRSGRELVMLRGMCREAGEMRRASHSLARLQLKRDHLELERRSQEQFMKAEFDKWLDTEEGYDWLRLRQERVRLRVNQLRERFGIEPWPPDDADGDQEQGLIKAIKG
jgi:hypothetical protein